MTRRIFLVALAMFLAASPAAEAQVETNRFQLAVHGGWQTYADGSALEGGAVVGADASYFLNDNIGVGLWSDFTLTESDGSMFPPAALSFVDSTTFTTVSMPANVWQYGAHAKLRLAGRTSPFLLAGAGGYTAFLDPQQVNGVESTSGLAVRFAAGVDFAVGDRTGFQLAVSDSWLPNWRPERLFPVREQFQNSRFPELNPDPGELSSSIHNFSFTAGITLVP